MSKNAKPKAFTTDALNVLTIGGKGRYDFILVWVSDILKGQKVTAEELPAHFAYGEESSKHTYALDIEDSMGVIHKEDLRAEGLRKNQVFVYRRLCPLDKRDQDTVDLLHEVLDWLPRAKNADITDLRDRIETKIATIENF